MGAAPAALAAAGRFDPRGSPRRQDRSRDRASAQGPAHNVGRILQAILGHSDVRTTIDRYAHLAPDYLRDEAERLRFGVPGPEPKAGPTAAPVPAVAVAGERYGVAPVLRDPTILYDGSVNGGAQKTKTPGVAGRSVSLRLERETGFGPATLSLGS